MHTKIRNPQLYEWAPEFTALLTYATHFRIRSFNRV